MENDRPAPVKLGLVGCGRIAQIVHLRVLSKLPSVQLVALADSDPSQLEEASVYAPLAAQYRSYSELVENSAVEGVVICLPPALHANSAIEAFDQGKHVYLEKPLTNNCEEARGVLSAWRRAGTVGMIGFNFRFNPLYAKARAVVESGTLGPLVAARSVFTVSPRWLPAWKRQRKSGGGVLLDLGSHHIDLARYLFQEEVEEVHASTRSQRVEGDTASLTLRMRSGLLVQSLLSMGSVEEHQWEIYGQKGKLSLDKYTSIDVKVMRPSAPFDPIHRAWDALLALHPKKIFHANAEPSFESALDAFAHAIRGGVASPDLEDGYKSLALVEAAEHSAIAGCSVGAEKYLRAEAYAGR